jgi:hypothetical protein
MKATAKISVAVCAQRARAGRALQLAFTTLQEIFDEQAYARFLARHQLQPSRGSYAAFREEHEHNKALRPKCC